MKNLIRKWLGIRDSIVVDEYMLRRMIGEAIQAALEGSPDSEWASYLSTIWTKNTLNSALERAARDTAINVAMGEISARIDTEEFIDKIVSRIKQKQLL